MLAAIAQPACELCFLQAAVGELNHCYRGFGFGGNQRRAVELKKNASDRESSALVAVYKWVVAADAGGVTGRELEQIRLAVRQQVLRARHCGIEQTFIAHAVRAAVIREQALVQSQRDIARDPSWFFHLASARNVLR